MQICPVCDLPIDAQSLSVKPIHSQCLRFSVLFSNAPRNVSQFKGLMSAQKVDSLAICRRFLSASDRIRFLRNQDLLQKSASEKATFGVSLEDVKLMEMGVVPFVRGGRGGWMLDRPQWEYNLEILKVVREVFRLRHPVFHYLRWPDGKEVGEIKVGGEEIKMINKVGGEEIKMIDKVGEEGLGKRDKPSDGSEGLDKEKGQEVSDDILNRFFVRKYSPKIYDLQNGNLLYVWKETSFCVCLF